MRHQARLLNPSNGGYYIYIYIYLNFTVSFVVIYMIHIFNYSLIILNFLLYESLCVL